MPPKTPYIPIVSLPSSTALDVIGDVHGEIDSLRSLLDHLGYTSPHPPQNRKLVFVGDILDRGPNSYEVFKLIKSLVTQNTAYCILGNHESNILRNDPKDGSGWFFNVMTGNEEKYLPCYFPSEEEKLEILAFIKYLPVAIERDDVRIVHACWDPVSISKIKNCALSFNSFIDFYEHFENEVQFSPADQKNYEKEQQIWGAYLKDPTKSIPYLPFTAKHYLQKQAQNPVRVLNSGPETNLDPDEQPFFVGGQWRMVKRADWWKSYIEKTPVVIGHYWREPPFEYEKDAPIVKIKKDEKFSANTNISWFGQNNNIYCVDYSVGKQFQNRAKNLPKGHNAKLAALQWPEKTLVLDCGLRFHTLDQPSLDLNIDQEGVHQPE